MRYLPSLIAGIVFMTVILLLGRSIYNRKKALKVKRDLTAKPSVQLMNAGVPKESPTPVSAMRETVTGTVYYVGPDGKDTNDGRSGETPFGTIQRAVDQARPGDGIELLPGIYFQDVITKRDGSKGRPIMLYGSKDAIVKGAGASTRIFEINHGYITLQGFSIDGKYTPEEDKESYRDKLIYAIGKTLSSGISNIRILNMTLTNAGGECIRLKNRATDNEVAYNLINGCGIYDFVFDDGGKNGEAIYIGTAPEQMDKKSKIRSDASNNNRIHHNEINSQGNECVDIKEGSSENVVEYNICTGQKDEESAGLDARGSRNTFRYNRVYGNEGAGVRLGGDGKADGTGNDVYGNEIVQNRSGGIKFQRFPQGTVCENLMDSNDKGNSVGSYGEEIDPTRPC